jgi:hypothetical protein
MSEGQRGVYGAKTTSIKKVQPQRTGRKSQSTQRKTRLKLCFKKRFKPKVQQGYVQFRSGNACFCTQLYNSDEIIAGVNVFKLEYEMALRSIFTVNYRHRSKLYK